MTKRLPIRSLIAASIVIALLIAAGIALEVSPEAGTLRETMRSRSVPAGMLDYGTLGKLLKRIGVIINEPAAENALVPRRGPSFGGNSFFRRKRSEGPLMNTANPKGFAAFPSSTIVKPDDLRPNWPLLSVVIDEKDLSDPETGVEANMRRRGMEWERPCWISYYEDGELKLATGAGFRIHGGGSRIWHTTLQSFRIYFRDRYGVNQVPAGLVLDPEAGPLKRFVVHVSAHEEGFVFLANVAFDIAARLGAQVPSTRMVKVLINGEPRGIYFITEHLHRDHWRNRIGHDDFLFYRYRAANPPAETAAYRALHAWARNFSRRLTMEDARRHIDLDNFSRHVFSAIWCGTTDWEQGSMILNRRDPESRWFWVNWDMDHSFHDFALESSVTEEWRQRALQLIISEDPRLLFRPALFNRLFAEDPAFRAYFLRLCTDLLNHRLSQNWLKELWIRYSDLARDYGFKNRDSLNLLRTYFEKRSDYVRQELQSWFGGGALYQCRIQGPPDRRYLVDGESETGRYEGTYFAGMTVSIAPADEWADQLRFWRLNGQRVDSKTLEFVIDRDTVIRPVFNKELR